MSNPPATLKAFVSSTFTDLKDHRARAIAALRRSGFHVDPMEDWDANSNEPSRFCLERLDGCDLCILLVAFRKGFVPQGQTCSITQMEYDEARKRGIPVLVFMLDDDAPWPRRFDEMQSDPGIRKWREQLMLARGVGKFGLAADSLDVMPAVTRWMQKRGSSAPSPPLPTSPFDFTSFLEQKRQGFVGREWLFEEIEQWRTQQKERSLLIVGDPGIGKSAIVAELIHRNAGGVMLAYHCCRADERSTLEPGKVVQALAAQIAARIPEYAACLREPGVAEAIGEANCNSDPVNAYSKGLLAPLSRLRVPSAGVCYLIFDALDETLDAAVRGLPLVQMLTHRLNELPSWLRIVATTRREEAVLRRLKGLRAVELYAQQERNRDDLRRCIKAYGITGPLARVLETKSEGNFLYLSHALAETRGAADPVNCVKQMPRGLEGIYLYFFERRFSGENGYEKTRSVLQVIVGAQEPLSEKQLATATVLDEEDELPSVLGGLSSFLVKRLASDGGEGWTLYHKSLSDWLTDTRTCGPLHYASPKKGRQRLADWCLAEYRRGVGRMDGYALRHLPGHLIETERWDDLATVLTDLFYLETRAEAGYIFALAADFTAAVAAMPREHEWHRRLGLLEQAIRLDIHFLARHPSTLFQSLWNRCWWYDCAAAAGYYRLQEQKASHPWEATGPKLSALLDQWRERKGVATPGFLWVRSLRPPQHHLGTALRQRFRGQGDWVTSVAISPDGRRLASGSSDHTVWLWDLETGTQLLCLNGHSDAVTSVSFASDGLRLASGSRDKTVRLWELETGSELFCLKTHTDWVNSVAFRPDGQCLASGSRDKTVRVWDLETRSEMHCLRGHTDGVNSVSFTPDGCGLVSGSWDNTILIWNLQTATPLHCLQGHQGGVNSVSVAEDGRRLASGSKDKTVRIWDIQTGTELLCLKRHDDGVNSVSFTPDGRRLASGSFDKTVRLWDPETGTQLLCLRGHNAKVNSVSFSPDGRRLASGSSDKSVAIWDLERGSELRSLKGHDDKVTGVSFAPDGLRLASGSYDKTVRVWDLGTGTELFCLKGHDGGVRSVLFAPNGRLISGAEDGTVRIWEAEKGTQLHCLEGHTNTVNSISAAPDGCRLASASSDGTVRIWNLETGAELLCLKGHEDGVKSASFSPDGRCLASASWDGTVRHWSMDSGECLKISRDRTDLTAFVSSPPTSRWRAVTQALETVIEDTIDKMDLAWFPSVADEIAAHPWGRMWGFGAGNNIRLFALEGPNVNSPPAGQK